jgi:membrane-associated phospholipid phosphatase
MSSATPNSPGSIEGWVWLGIVGVLSLLLVLAYGYLLVHRRRSQIWLAIDGSMSRRAPGLWLAFKSRVSRTGRRRLGLFMVVGFFLVTSYFFAEITDGWSDRGELHAIDQRVYLALVETSSPAVEAFLAQLTHLGSLYAGSIISCLLLGVFYYQRSRQHALALVLIMGVGEAVAWGLKLVFARARPEDSLVKAAGDAFPSGHAFTAFALYAFLIYLVWGWTDKTVWRIMATVLFGATAILIAASRILLRVHWFSDVLGGSVLGLGWLVVSLLSVRLLR